MRFAKYQALGNDYIVVEAALTPAQARALCDRRRGVGADGVAVVGPTAADDVFGVTIWNPDGSRAEMSGNGLRIVARYLWDEGRATTARPFTLDAGARWVTARVPAGGDPVTVELGAVELRGATELMVGDSPPLLGVALSLGNPHFVIRRAVALADEARRWGPLLEVADLFPDRTNVQFVEVVDRRTLRLEIWERGAGYTLASGSSAAAAAATAVWSRWCHAPVTVRMPGGAMVVDVDAALQVTLTGPVAPVMRGEIAPGVFDG